MFEIHSRHLFLQSLHYHVKEPMRLMIAKNEIKLSIIYFFVADTEILNSQLSMELGQKNCSDDLCMDSSSLAILGEPSLHVDQVSHQTNSEEQRCKS